jgi:hypothetical protein
MATSSPYATPGGATFDLYEGAPEINPITGKPWGTEEEYNQWQDFERTRAGAAGRDASTASHNAGWQWTGDVPDWGHTGWNVTNDQYYNKGAEWYVAPENMIGFQIGENVGYLNPSTGEISYGKPGALTQTGYDAKLFGGYGADRDMPGVAGNSVEGFDNTFGTVTGHGYWQLAQDYGLGSDMLGIIPIQHDATGRVSWYSAPAPGGGFITTQDPLEAKMSRDAYEQWLGTNPAGGGIAGQGPPPNGGATGGGSTAGGGPTGPGYTEPGLLTTPGQGEQFYDETKGFYTQPTEQRKQWDIYKDQPTAQEERFNAYNGVYGSMNTSAGDLYDKYADEYGNLGTAAGDLYGNYADIFGNPNYLDDYYARKAQEAQTTLDRKAASAGWGASGAHARATANTGLAFADAARLGMQGFAQTGMGLASAADAAKNAKAQTGMGLAASADTSRNAHAITGMGLARDRDQAILDKIAAGGRVDEGELARILSGQQASGSAQGLTENRLTGSIKYAMDIGNDMAALTMMGVGEEEAYTLQNELAQLTLAVQNGQLDTSQAYAQASELMQSYGVLNQAAMNMYLMNKFGGSGSK